MSVGVRACVRLCVCMCECVCVCVCLNACVSHGFRCCAQGEGSSHSINFEGETTQNSVCSSYEAGLPVAS